MQVILRAMDDIDPRVSLEKAENEASKIFILNTPADPDSEYTQVFRSSKAKTLFIQEFYDHVKRCWADKGVLACYERSSEYQLIDCAK